MLDHHRLIIRERRHRVVVLSAALALAAGCSKAPESREVADRFMDLYYARMRVGEAVRLCSGAARTRLESELKVIQTVPTNAPAGEPRVTFTLTTSANPAPTQATYTYRVTAHTSDVGPVVTTLTLAEEDGHWLVTALHEGEGPPPS